MNIQHVCDEIHDILLDMEHSMKASKSMHGCDSKDKETAYRAGYYAAINDTRRLIAESPIIIESLYHHNYYS